jgi:Eco29kI restriction endonuclease
LECDAVFLEDVDQFNGAGIYALYYSGAHPLYQPITGLTTPIYVGKATSLIKRLWEHLKTLRSVKLYAADFWVRCLIVDDIWIPLAENYLIRHFRPLWNSILDGFGDHAPGAGRYQSAKPDWHVLHPGVDWAD